MPTIQPSTASFTDDPNTDDDDWSANPTQTQPDRLVYSTPPLKRAETVSGTTKVTLAVSSSTPAAELSAVLVDYGTTTMRHYDNDNGDEGLTKLTTSSCFGDSTAEDSACYFNTAPDTETVNYDVFQRGWADLGHYQSLASQQQLTPGKSVHDHLHPQHHRPHDPGRAQPGPDHRWHGWWPGHRQPVHQPAAGRIAHPRREPERVVGEPATVVFHQ